MTHEKMQSHIESAYDATAFHDIESYHITTIEAAVEWLTLRMARNQPHPLDYRRLREEVEEDNVMPLDILLCAVAVVTGKWVVMAAFSNGRRGTVVNDLPGFSLLYLPKDHPLKVKSTNIGGLS